jgi:hypothetical protein
VDDALHLIGVDACVLIAAVASKQPLACRVITGLAERQAFRLLLIDKVEEESRRALSRLGMIPDLEALLNRCLLQRCLTPSRQEVLAALPVFLPVMRHRADVAIAMALKQAQPYAFVTDNIKHWPPALEALLGGVRIFEPLPFVESYRSRGR